jgi:dipeptidyl-peptidase-3
MNYQDERFADIQLLRYRLDGFEQLSLSQKQLVYYLSEATLWGRDITFDQYGRHNLRIRRMLEAIYTDMTVDRDSNDFRAMEEYLKRLWFSSGIHHHYGCDKFQPAFSAAWLWQQLQTVSAQRLPLRAGETLEELKDELFPVIFDPTVLAKRVNKADGQDLLQTSACNFYQGVTQQEAEQYYRQQKDAAADDPQPVSYGLNTTLVKDAHGLHEEPWCAQGRYANAIRHIVYWLEKARSVAENERQRRVVSLLIEYYQTGDLRRFNDYCIEWVGEQEGRVDFVNGFIEVYGDPLGLKGSWEGIVEYKDLEATRRTQTISQNAQWFEDHSPVDPRFRKPQVKGVTANAICAAMLGGEEYPSTAIGINLPNADWIRAQHGSKSITITNITDAYNKAARGSGFKEEFIIDDATRSLIDEYDDLCNELHTDLHECLGHGSGQLLPGTDPDALKAYGNTIEEARADLFGLYYMADTKLLELGLLPDPEAYKSHYYTYIMNGMMTQLIRIEPGRQIEEAHMRNRALIAHWCYEQGDVIRMERHEGKTFVRITDYEALRTLFARLLAEVQRIKSEGDYEAARRLVEQYAVHVDAGLHQEVLERYRRLNLAPYKGFINPQLIPVLGDDGRISDVTVSYAESYAHQMLRYSSEYGALI